MNRLNKFSILKWRMGFIILFIFLVSNSQAQIKVRVAPAAKQSLTDICHTTNVKLVFLCQDSLWYVDFSESIPQIRKMNINGSPYFPVISSDGKWVTYQTDVMAEGPSKDPNFGKVWIRQIAVDANPLEVADSAYVPRFVLNSPVDSPEIIYSTSLTCPQGLCYTAGKTVKKRIIGNSVQAAQSVYDNGSYYGGLSWDNRYLSTGWPGGPNVFMLDLQNTGDGPRGLHTMRVKKTGTNADTVVTLQACNMSRSASRVFTNAMLYYDFSSAAIKAAGCYHPILGEWGEHELLFISRYDGEDLKVFALPSDRPVIPISQAQGLGEATGKEWENPEWSNHPYYAAASLTVDRLFQINGNWDNTQNGELAYLVSLKDSVFIRLIETTDTSFTSTTQITYPFLWIETPTDFQEDSVWLKTTIWERANIGVKRPYNAPNGGALENLNNLGTIDEIILCSPNGEKIACIKPLKNERIDLRRMSFKIKPGVYFVRIKSQKRDVVFERLNVGN
jgi:hypothetical protein